MIADFELILTSSLKTLEGRMPEIASLEATLGEYKIPPGFVEERLYSTVAIALASGLRSAGLRMIPALEIAGELLEKVTPYFSGSVGVTGQLNFKESSLYREMFFSKLFEKPGLILSGEAFVLGNEPVSCLRFIKSTYSRNFSETLEYARAKFSPEILSQASDSPAAKIQVLAMMGDADIDEAHFLQNYNTRDNVPWLIEHTKLAMRNFNKKAGKLKVREFVSRDFVQTSYPKYGNSLRQLAKVEDILLTYRYHLEQAKRSNRPDLAVSLATGLCVEWLKFYNRPEVRDVTKLEEAKPIYAHFSGITEIARLALLGSMDGLSTEQFI